VESSVDALSTNHTRSYVALALRRAIEAERADMVVGDFDWPGKRFAGAVVGIYRPLVEDLFPDALHVAPRMPFSGFRILDAGLDIGPLPPRWGAETYLNLHLVAERRRVVTEDLGTYEGPDRLKTVELGLDVAQVILDLAERHGRIESALRPRWEAWVRRAMTVLSTQPDVGEHEGDYLERLNAVPAWPRPRSRALATTG
jgi:hypothetical protein